jgi:AraC-like DNA-binding protein
MNSITRFSSLPPAEQFDSWRDAVSSAFVPLDATCRAHDAFGGELVLQHVGAVQLSQVSGGAVDVERSPGAIRRADPGYLKLGMQLRGYCLVTQDGREAPLVPGDFALYDTRRPYRLSFDSAFQMLVVMFPRELLSLRHQDLARLTARRVSGRSGVGGLVSPFLVSLAGKLRAEEVSPTFELSSAVLDVLTAALSEQLECESRVSPETHRHALMVRIKAFIDERLDDPELCTAVVASAHHISHRYLQKLFESEGTTVTEWIRHRRLVHCSRELVDPRFVSAPISTIAARWGLVDASHFSKIFRSAYGMSPREFRVENAGQRDHLPQGAAATSISAADHPADLIGALR